jgi:hypothetical protein
MPSFWGARQREPGIQAAAAQKSKMNVIARLDRAIQ